MKQMLEAQAITFIEAMKKELNAQSEQFQEVGKAANEESNSRVFQALNHFRKDHIPIEEAIHRQMKAET